MMGEQMTRISVAVALTLFVTIVKLSPLYAKNEHVKSVTAIAEVFGDGQKVSAVAVEYDKEVVNAQLNQSAFGQA